MANRDFAGNSVNEGRGRIIQKFRQHRQISTCEVTGEAVTGAGTSDSDVCHKDLNWLSPRLPAQNQRLSLTRAPFCW